MLFVVSRKMILDFYTQIGALETPVKEIILTFTLTGIVAVVWSIYNGVVYAMQQLGTSSHKAKNWCTAAAMMIFINFGLYMVSFWSPEALKLTWTINFFVLFTVLHFFVMEKFVYNENVLHGGGAIVESLKPDNQDKASKFHSMLWLGGFVTFLIFSLAWTSNNQPDIGWACQILAILMSFAMNKDIWHDGNWIDYLMPVQHAILHVMCCMSPVANTQLRFDLFKIWRGSTTRDSRKSLCEWPETLLVVLMIVCHAILTRTFQEAIASIFWTSVRVVVICYMPMSWKKIKHDYLQFIMLMVVLCFWVSYNDLQVECGFQKTETGNIEFTVGTVKYDKGTVNVDLTVTWKANEWRTPTINARDTNVFDIWKSKNAQGMSEAQLPWHALHVHDKNLKCQLNVPILGWTLASTADNNFPLQWMFLNLRWSTPLDMVQDWDLGFRRRVEELKYVESENLELKTTIHKLNRQLNDDTISTQLRTCQSSLIDKTRINEAMFTQIETVKKLVTDNGADDLNDLISSANICKRNVQDRDEEIDTLKYQKADMSTRIKKAGYQTLQLLIDTAQNLTTHIQKVETGRQKCIDRLVAVDNELVGFDGKNRTEKINRLVSQRLTCNRFLEDAKTKQSGYETTIQTLGTHLEHLKTFSNQNTHALAVDWARTASQRIIELREALVVLTNANDNMNGHGATSSEEAKKFHKIFNTVNNTTQ